MSNWKNFDTTFKSKEPYEYFMVRVKGLHPARGTKYIPIVVQLIDGCLYTADNELEPITFTKLHEEFMTPTNNPYQADLEWMEIPE